MKASATVNIHRPIAEVFEFLADVENLDAWMNGVSEPQMTSPDGPEAGATFSSVYTYVGRSHTLAYEFAVFEPPTKLLWRTTSGPFPYESEMTLEPTEEGARVANSVDAGPTGFVSAIWFALFAPLLRPSMGRQLRRELMTLKDLLETEGEL
ncbi:MAG: hypothetical protein FI707_00815 [SAR202 cluster bacterium]|jgi:carbon monoxide dehydrogenase subunit G|nr:hypothetical protein [Chloroflexota bacterium]MDP6421958.1 SRPBCC family protein [SAR202 cluster bacterium]HAL49420.1 hypothetical protein [Dehalococcoidia bacterium]MDP6662682.1 SRPBCC family protein [SAR202 cluster bacterium]MDP6799467.1 SRPBCC family protein [SAR202 cluster bacterium]|tara:strand:- start:948 stop:1403 length:456 start_codon:yes stop_codon:yes gene_type:complete